MPKPVLSPMPIQVAVAGPVRDCADGLAERLDELARAIDRMPGVTASYFLCENDSADDTLHVLQQFAAARPRVHVFDESGLHHRLPRREQRLAFCRNLLLEAIEEEFRDAAAGRQVVYLPVDLDLPIPWDDLRDSLYEMFHLVLSGQWNGIFPISDPYYYDIHALRADGWNEDDAGNRFFAAKGERLTSHLPKWVRGELYVHAPQLSSRRLADVAPFIRVQSAFGGLGIYRLAAVAGKRYASSTTDRCEHVGLNRDIPRLAIATSLVIPAPFEHLGNRSRKRPHQLLLRLLVQQLFWWRRRLDCKGQGVLRPRRARRDSK